MYVNVFVVYGYGSSSALVWQTNGSCGEGHDSQFVSVMCDPQDICNVLFSSGTTGILTFAHMLYIMISFVMLQHVIYMLYVM